MRMWWEGLLRCKDGAEEVGAVGEAVEEVEFSYGLYLSQRAEGQALTVF